MAEQFDLYRDPQGSLLLVLQSDAVDTLDTRVFASVVPTGKGGVSSLDRLSVPLNFAEREYRVMLNLLGTARLGWMGERVGNYAHLRDQITRAFDLLYSGI
ncbi:CcdB family protein [Tabrizicola sp. M-4]|uniref:CcdB family protein n=1 Tax=Tabrizicola sp. M-4 TaxID=3055847 RepID=UPI003DA862FD